MERYEEDPLVSVDLIDSIFKYTVMNHEVISTLLWDIKVNDLYEDERQKIVKDADYLLQEQEHRCLAIIHNISKYWERLHRQVYMKKRLGLIAGTVDASPAGSNGSDDMLGTIFSDVGPYVTDGKKLESVVINNWEFDDEYDNRFGGLDGEIIPGYEPTPMPIFSVGGFKIPDTFGMFKKVRGRPKTNPVTTSFIDNYRFLTNYEGESNEDKLERERDEKMKKEIESSKKGKTIKKVTLKVVPFQNLTTPPTPIKVPVVKGKIVKCDPTLLKVKELVKSGLPSSNCNSSIVSTPHTASIITPVKSIPIKPVNFVPPARSTFVPSDKPAFIPPSNFNSPPSVKSSSVKQVPIVKQAKRGRKPKVILVLTSQFTPRLKSLSPQPVNKCKGRPLGSCNKPKVVDLPPPPQTFNFESIPQYTEAYPAYIPLHPLAQIEKEIKRPQMCIPMPKQLIVPHVLLNNNGEEIGRVGFKEVKEDEEQKKRGRPLGSTNVGPTKESDKNVIIHDKEIPFSDNPTNFEKYLIQYARKNRDISSSEWNHHVQKVFGELKEMSRKMVDERLADWEKKNKMVIKDYKIHLLDNINMLYKIRSGELKLDDFDINDISEDDIIKPYVPIYMFDGYNNHDIDNTIRDVEQYILYDRARGEVEPIRTYDDEDNSIINRIRKQKSENYLCSSNVVIDRSVSRKIRNEISGNADRNENIIGDILKALKTPGLSIANVLSKKLESSVPDTPVTITESEDDSVYITMNVDEVSEISEISEESIEDIVEEMVAGSCDGNKGIYDEVFGESESESINGSIYRNYIHDDIISGSDSHSESGSNTNNSDVPHESPIVSHSDNSSEDDYVHELDITQDDSIVDVNELHVVNNVDVVDDLNDLDDEVVSHATDFDSDVNNSVDIPHVENIDDSDSDIIDNNHVNVTDVIDTVDDIDVSVNNVDNIPESNVPRPIVYNNVFDDNINNVILPRLDPYSDEVVDYEYERRPGRRDSDDSDDSESDISDSDDESENGGSDNDNDERRRESNRNMFSFFFNEMNIIGSGGLKHNINNNYVHHEEERPAYVEPTVEAPVENNSCGFSSYKDFLDFNNVETVDQKEEDVDSESESVFAQSYNNSGYTSYKDFLDTNKYVNDTTPTYGSSTYVSSGYTSYKDFLDTNKDVVNSTQIYGSSGYSSYNEFLSVNNVSNVKAAETVNNDEVKVSTSKSKYNGSKYKSYKDFLN